MMRVLLLAVLLSSPSFAQMPACNAERASLLFDQGPSQVPRLMRCNGQYWMPYELNDSVVEVKLPPEKSPEEIAQCKASCTTQNAYCLKNQCGPIAGAPCKQRCAKSLAICTSGCTPRPIEPIRTPPPTPDLAPIAPATVAPVAPVSNTVPPPLPPRPPEPSALETVGKTLDVVNRGLDVVGGSNQPAAPSSGNAAPMGASASATCCVNGAGYSCPSAAAVDRCSGAFMRCLMSGKNDRTCLKEAPPDPSGCRRDMSVSCK